MNTIAEQRQYVLDMRDETLARLYDDKPIAKEQIKKAAGYGIFSNIGSHIFLLSTGSGYGVITDNKDKKPDAVLKTSDKGDAFSAAKSVDLDIITYQLTESGAALQATLQDTKYWKHKDLDF